MEMLGSAWKYSVIQKSVCSTVTGWVGCAAWFWGELVLLASAAVDGLCPLRGEGWSGGCGPSQRASLQLLMNHMSVRIHMMATSFLEKKSTVM